MRKIFITSPGVFLTLVLVVFPGASSAGTDVYRLVDSPFTWYQCYALGDWIEGPARYFDTDVCVEYQALNTVTTRIKTNRDGSEDVGWTLLQKGTATVYKWTNYATRPGPNPSGFPPATTGDLLYTGPFHVEEIGQDDQNDSGCLDTDPDGNPVAWLGKCGPSIWSTLEFARYHWKITGSKVYFYEFRVDAPGTFCYMDDHEVIYDGGGCPGP